MRWLVLIVLAACNGKQSAAPAIDSIDRSCKIDADCTMTGDPSCCGTSCGRDFGDAVNAKAWAKASSIIRARCKGEQCAVMCPKLPDCREEAVAVCRSGVCDRVMKKTAECEQAVTPDAAPAPPSSDDACETVDDCTLYTLSGCCDRCLGVPMNRAAAARKQKDDEAACANKKVECPILDCKRLPVDCVAKKCVQR